MSKEFCKEKILETGLGRKLEKLNLIDFGFLYQANISFYNYWVRSSLAYYLYGEKTSENG